MEKLIKDPLASDLRQYVAAMPNARETEWGNFNVKTRVTARSSQSTYIVSDHKRAFQTITRGQYTELEKIQQAYIADHEMIAMTGWIGIESAVSVPICLWVEKSCANIAAMQKQLLFNDQPVNENEAIFNVYSTPNLPASGYPDDCAIAVDFEHYTTRILGTDYFGEAKKASLRMWNKWIYDLGGLALHAGCKTYFDAHHQEKSVIIIGLSGTGKTATTFSSHLNSLPVQDDFCALFPGGRLYASENGCFAKTYRLNEKNEPVIYCALKSPHAYLENVSVNSSGAVDYDDGSCTTNGRGTFSLESIPHRSPLDLPPVSHILLLNRNFNIIPAISKLNNGQAAEYFMLGETTGTSAGGKAEAGKALRVPGTNPFFFAEDALQGKRFAGILRTMPEVQVILLNTGRVGGDESQPSSKKVNLQHSTRLIERLLRDEITWQEDEDFGYLVPDNSIESVDEEIIYPKKLYVGQGRLDEYMRFSLDLKRERKFYLAKFMN